MVIFISFELIRNGDFELVGSETLRIEISAIRDDVRKNRIKAIYRKHINDDILLSDGIVERAKQLQTLTGMKSFDSMHVASAEQNADIFLSVDKGLLKASKRADLKVKVMNPIIFLAEVINNDTNS